MLFRSEKFSNELSRSRDGTKKAQAFNYHLAATRTIESRVGQYTQMLCPGHSQIRGCAMTHSTLENNLRNLGLLFLRFSAAAFLLVVHGLPKLLDFQNQLTLIEDPFHLGAQLTLSLAIFAEVLCPLLIAAGVFVRLACLPILVVLLVALLIVHPQWSVEQGQFGWLLLIIFTTVLIAGPGRLALNARFNGAVRYV